ncbi:MAG: UV DNA damage repair endonuclease UvsE, partial [Chlamydiia bacterium]|nr:UV DNA damage repair endonuclease UvsE [Chlamydiia bacterium]
PVCRELGIPLVYDVHHHRCLQDELTIDEATDAALERWNRPPLFHISSPKNGWQGPQTRLHSDDIAIDDFPKRWLSIPNLTVDVEAKAKELAVLKLLQEIEDMVKP